MAMIIFIIVAILVAAGLVTMNIRSSSRRGAHDEQETPPHEESPSAMPPVTAQEAAKPEAAAVPPVSAQKETEAKETAVQPVPEVQTKEDTLKMDDNAYRSALKSMKTHTDTPKAKTEVPAVQPKMDTKMNDYMYRETLKSMRNQDNKK